MKLEVENLIGEFTYNGEDRPDLTKVIHGEIGAFHFATNKSIVLAVRHFLCQDVEVVHNIEVCNRIHDCFDVASCDEFCGGEKIHLAAHRAFHKAQEWLNDCFESDGSEPYDESGEILKRSFVKVGGVVIQARYALSIFRMSLALCDKMMKIGVDNRRKMVLVKFIDEENGMVYAKILAMGVQLEYAEKGSCVYDSETAELLEVK